MITFPSFAPGTPGTLLDAENAQKVKAFIEAFNRPRVVLGNRDAIHISDSNVTIELDLSPIYDQIAAALAEANTAYEVAYEAQVLAEAAQASADNAQSAADSAQSTAEAAQSAADNAESIAAGAGIVASTAQETAETAQEAAEAAQEAADTASDYIAGITEVSVGTCDPGGTINVLTR